MESAFPLGLPFATAFYLIFYLATLVIHVVFMNYVLAGTLFIAYRGWFGRESSPAANIAIDWMPLMLSGAITAAIAPLLFLQILYKQEFYTANLLLFHRWMSILPVLIVGFYSLYLLKTPSITSRWVRAGLSLAPFACVAFTGYSWTENHLLSVRPQSEWAEFYKTRSMWYAEPALWPRLLMWAVGAVPTLCCVLAWQLWYRRETVRFSMALSALIGLVGAGAAGWWYFEVAGDVVRPALFGPFASGYLIAATLGVVIQGAGWSVIALTKQATCRSLLVVSLGLVLTLTGMTVCREAIRLTSLGWERFESYFGKHEEALGKSGFYWFLLFFAVNAGLIAYVFHVVRSQHKMNSLPPTASGKDPPMKSLWLALAVCLCLGTFLNAQTIRVGIIGLDTSHVTAFTKILNAENNVGDLAGFKVVAAFPGGSKDYKPSATRVAMFTEKLKKDFGVEMVDSIEELCKKVDVVLLESVDGRPHLQQLIPVLKAGKRCFVDKPVAASLADAVQMYELSKQYKTPIWSSSSLRFGSNIDRLKRGKLETVVAIKTKDTPAKEGKTELHKQETSFGKLVGMMVSSPCEIGEHHPDLFWYGIHGVEAMYAVMGPGCKTVQRTHTAGTDIVTGVWSDGRVGTYRGQRAGKGGYAAYIWGTEASGPADVSAKESYTPMLVEICKFFRTGMAPVSPEETIELIAFMQAADESKANNGAAVNLADLIAKARVSVSPKR